MDLNYEYIVVTTLISVVAFIAWRVWTIETTHLTNINTDLAEIKNDIKWLIKVHEQDHE